MRKRGASGDGHLGAVAPVQSGDAGLKPKKTPIAGGSVYPSEEGTNLAETVSRVREQEVFGCGFVLILVRIPVGV
jgi:hypothetical protein